MQARLEFRLIERLRHLGEGSGVVLGIGDDAAVLEPRSGARLVAACDTLVGGVHFPARTLPGDVGWKALAVNLSDLAAMGAAPRWTLLALTLPDADEAWLDAFADGWRALAADAGVALVGGDLSQGPLSATVTVLGEVPADAVVTRTGARSGDVVAVTGTLGDAALALALLKDGAEPAPELLARLNRPQPRLAAGTALRGLASACIDVSDGLAADLGHLVEASEVGARVNADTVPRSARLAELGADGLTLALTGGDDYELCFSFSPEHRDAVATALAGAQTPWTEIGEIVAGKGVAWFDADGAVELAVGGYAHFER